MALKKLVDYLDQNNIRYVSIRHSTAYTSQEVAQSAHIAGRELAKSVIVKADGEMAMVVLPASFKVNLERLQEMLGANKVELARESEFRGLFPECEIGAMPPFGNLYGLDVYVDESLSDDEEIFFNAGTHTELIRMSYDDFERLVEPKIAACCEKATT